MSVDINLCHSDATCSEVCMWQRRAKPHACMRGDLYLPVPKRAALLLFPEFVPVTRSLHIPKYALDILGV